MARWMDEVSPTVFSGESTSFITAVHRFDLEHDNLRAAVTCSRQSGQHAEGIAMMGDWNYWSWRDEDINEFQSYVQSPLPVDQFEPEMQDKYLTVSALLARARGELELAASQMQACLNAARQWGNERAEGFALVWLGRMALTMDRFDEAERCFAEVRALSPGPECQLLLAIWEPELLLRRGELERARQAFQEALRYLEGQTRSYYVLWASVMAIRGRAQVEHMAGDDETAARLARQAIGLCAEMEHRGGLIGTLRILAVASAGLGLPDVAACLWGYSFGAIPSKGSATGAKDMTGRLAEGYSNIMDDVCCRLGEERYADLCAHGRAMTWTEMVTYALSNETTAAAGRS
jgi:tetratricopeptide (TPR) repeat protein